MGLNMIMRVNILLKDIEDFMKNCYEKRHFSVVPFPPADSVAVNQRAEQCQ